MKRAEPYSILRAVTIQFPDPWIKSRHKKRRVVQPDLVASIARHLPLGGWLFFQTDVLELAEDARDTIYAEARHVLVDKSAELDDWSIPKPSELDGITTERERSCAELGRPIYRRMFVKASSGDS